MSVPPPSQAPSQAPSQQQEQEAEALATAVAADFLLTEDEVAQLVDAILTARLTSYAAAYQAAADIADADYDTPANPVDDLPAPVRRHHQSAAHAAAASIAATYARDLASRAAGFLLDWPDAHGGSLAGAEEALRGDLATYTETRAAWKSHQVANYETGAGAQDGTLDARDDLESGDLTDDNGDPIDYSQLYVAVLPESSSSDFCAEFAGNVYRFDDAPQLDFPAHLGCVHYQVILTAADVDLNDLAE